MAVWVVVGGQYGSEGKGKVSAVITLQEKIDICVRCGGPNSGHAFVDSSGTSIVLRQLPTGFVRPETRLLIPAGGLIDLQVLKAEIQLLGLGPDRVGIDKRAMIINAKDRLTEAELQLGERLSSTLCGVGSAVSRRALRGEDVLLAGDVTNEASWLLPYLAEVSEEVNDGIDLGKKVLVEGTQGSGLSLYHSEYFPKATSRDTNAAGFLSEIGISPLSVKEIVLVIRTFPIRVAGAQAGPLYEELSWEELGEEAGFTEPVQEFTTVSRKLRRLGRFDWAGFERAVRFNRPTQIALNFVDYLGAQNRGAVRYDELNTHAKDFIGTLSEYGIPITYLGTGPSLVSNIHSPRGITTSEVGAN
jgi:adenylosuccinate synthase